MTNYTEELMPLLWRKYVYQLWKTKHVDFTIRLSVKNRSCYHVLGLFNIYFAIILPVGEEHHFVYHRGGLRLSLLWRKYVCQRRRMKPADFTIRLRVKNWSCYHVMSLFNIYFAIILPVGEEHYFVYHRGGLCPRASSFVCFACGL